MADASAPDAAPEAAAAPEAQSGSVLFAGATDWAQIGRTGGGKKNKEEEAQRAEDYPNLLVPHRLKALEEVKVSFVAAGSAACHCIIGDDKGQCWTWGRNEKGQLGHGDLKQRNRPTVVEGLDGVRVTGGAGGKNHTVVITADGKSFAWGQNKEGQCGIGSTKPEQLLKPGKAALVEGARAAACGVDFTLWLCGGRVWSCGHPQYGVLGHGTDHEYNAKDSSVKLMYAARPTPQAIQGLAAKQVVRIAAGHQHCLALTDDQAAYTWGNGGYGRLGHNEQKDSFAPRQVETLTGRTPVEPNSVAACGATSTFCCTLGPQLMAWGKLKVSGENNMRPKPVNELAGWSVRSMACGATTFGLAGVYGDDVTTVMWGHAQHGELAYGPKGKKSSANPDRCGALDGAKVEQVALGIGYSLFLVDSASPAVAEAPVYEPAVEEEAAEAPPEEAPAAPGGKKRKAAGPAAAANGKAAKGKGKKR